MWRTSAGSKPSRVRVDVGEREAKPLRRVDEVLGSEAGVDQDQAGGRRLDQEAMAGEPPAVQAQPLDAGAVEMVDDETVGHALLMQQMSC